MSELEPVEKKPVEVAKPEVVAPEQAPATDKGPATPKAQEAVQQPAGNQQAAADLGLKAPDTAAPVNFDELKIETVEAATDKAQLDRSLETITQSLNGIDSKKGDEVHGAALKTTESLNQALAAPDAKARGDVITNAAPAITRVTDATLKSGDQAKVNEVFTGLATAAEKAGPEHVNKLASAMIANIKTDNNPHAKVQFLEGMKAAMKDGNTLLAASLAKQMSESKDPALQNMAKYMSGNVTSALTNLQGDHAAATAKSAQLQTAFQKSAAQMKAAGLPPEKIAEAEAAFKKEHAATFAAEEKAAARFGASMQGAAFAAENKVSTGSRSDDAKRDKALDNQMLLAPTLARTEAGSGVIADALAAKGQGQQRTWIDTARDAGKRFDADEKTKGYSDHLNGAIQVGGGYGLTVNAGLNDANGLGDVAAGLAEYAATPDERTALQKLSDEARMAGHPTGLPDDRKSAGKLLENAIGRFDKAAKRGDEAGVPVNKEAAGRLKNLSDALKGGLSLKQMIEEGKATTEGVGDAATGASKALELAGGTDGEFSARNTRGKAAGLVGLLGGGAETLDKVTKIDGLKGLLDAGISGAGLAKDGAELLGKKALTKGIGKALPWAGLAMDGMNFLEAANKGDTYGAISAAAPAAGGLIGFGVGGPVGAAVGYGIGSVVQVGMDVGRAMFGENPGTTEMAATERQMMEGLGLDKETAAAAVKQYGGFDKFGNSNIEGVNAVAQQMGLSTKEFLDRVTQWPHLKDHQMSYLRDSKGNLDPARVKQAAERLGMTGIMQKPRKR